MTVNINFLTHHITRPQELSGTMIAFHHEWTDNIYIATLSHKEHDRLQSLTAGDRLKRVNVSFTDEF